MNITALSDEQWLLCRLSAPLLTEAIMNNEFILPVSWYLEPSSRESAEYFVLNGVDCLPVTRMNDGIYRISFFLIVSRDGSISLVKDID